VNSDVEYLDLHPVGPSGQHVFTVVERLARLDGRLYGGTALAASVVGAELRSARPVVWMTTQFVSTVELGDRVHVDTEILAAGRRTHQVRVTATDDEGKVIFASLGATGAPRPDGLTGTFECRPRVTPPGEGEIWAGPFTGMLRAAGLADIEGPIATKGFGVAIEMRSPEVLEHPDPGPGRLCVWMRRQDRRPITPALTAFLADVVPMGVADGLGVVAGGTSLDNTIRFGPAVETEWVLMDLRPHLALGGYGHGVVHVWAEDGTLVATASQSASMIEFDLDQLGALLSAPQETAPPAGPDAATTEPDPPAGPG
jgi:acyl-CoA thioesterase